MTDQRPFVSVLIPVRNEERYIERCLYAVAAQDYPRERLEVIVIDGMSSDDTTAMIRRFAAESTIDLKLLRNPVRRTAAGLNLGLAAARGEIIVRVDGHAAIATDFIRRSVDALLASGVDCVGGVIESEGDRYIGRAVALAMSSRFGIGGASFRTGGAGLVDTVAFGAYRRDVFDRIGGFAEDIDKGEDDEFNYRLLDHRGRILLAPEIRATYTVRGDLGGVWRQYFGYGRAKVEVLRRHPAQARPRQLLPAALVASLAISLLAMPRAGWRPTRIVAGVYGLFVAVASMTLALRRSLRLLPMLPAVLTCLHFSYGLGFLTGVFGLIRRIASSKTSEHAGQSTEARA
jgi:succinoglycan biosynthesis protein ExoA